MQNNLNALKANREKKRDFMQKLLKLTQLEYEQMQADEMQALVSTTKKWSNLSQRIDGLEHDYHKMLEHAAQRGETANAGETDALNQEIYSIAIEINQAQKKNNTLSALKLDRYKQELREVRQSNKRLSSYMGAYSQSDGLYFDEKQ